MIPGLFAEGAFKLRSKSAVWPGRTHGDVADILEHWSPFLSERAAVIAYVRKRGGGGERETGREGETGG